MCVSGFRILKKIENLFTNKGAIALSVRYVFNKNIVAKYYLATQNWVAKYYLATQNWVNAELSVFQHEAGKACSQSPAVS